MNSQPTDTFRIYCEAKERTAAYEADVVPDVTVTEVIAGLNEADYLPVLAPGERWRVLHLRTDSDLTPNTRLDGSGVQDGDQLEFLRDSHGAEA